MANFLTNLFGGKRTKVDTEKPAAQALTTPGREVPASFREDLEVSGESFHRDGMGRIFQSLGRAEGGVTMQTAHLIPEPKNKYDKNAVRVVIMGEQIGYVPEGSSAAIARICAGVGRDNVAVVLARIWSRNDEGTWRSRVTLSFSGERESEKDYAADRQEAEARYAERELEKERKAADKVVREAEKIARRAAGSVEGQYWPLLKSSIAELKRQKRFEEATQILDQCVEAAEREGSVTGEIPDSWPSEQMSMVLRRLKEHPRELNYLERYVAVCGDREVPDSVMTRLSRSRLAVERDEANK